MKVICVQSFARFNELAKQYGIVMPEVGSEYNSIAEEIAESGTPCLVLAEYPACMSFDAAGFATLPEATATEMYEEEFEGVMQ